MYKFIFIAIAFLNFSVNAHETRRVYLSGTGPENTKTWDFYCTDGRNSDKWTTIEVPSCWELQGYGTYNYGHDKPKADERGLYKRKFLAPQSWKGKHVKIVFDGVMTDADVKINGKSAGPIHKGAFYRFSYDISELVKYGYENEILVTVSKMSSNASVNVAERKADYWVFGGIFRPVFLEIKPEQNIKRVAIDAKADGAFKMNTYLNQASENVKLKVTVYDLDSNVLGSPIIKDVNGSEVVTLTNEFHSPKLWSPEFPNLYRAEIVLFKDEEIIHKMSEKFGFRTVELRRHDGLYVNGKKIRFKGVNRHSFYPSTGRTTSKEMSIMDVNLMKAMNMNAVRMSHYPPNKHFLEVCDSLGLFVLNELAGWQDPPYDTEVGEKLVRELIIRDVNHPSIIMWDNGNEGGWNRELDDDFAKWDIQKRPLIHPWAIFNGMDTQHYKDYGYGAGVFFNGDEVFFPTEILHGLYDGGHGAGLEDYWRLMKTNPLSAGAFLWAYVDEAVVRTDLNDSLDSDGNHAPDGILGPYREKEGSFYTIKEIWSPIQLHKPFITREFNGDIPVTNEYFYTNLSECKFVWEAHKLTSPIFDSEVEIIGKGTIDDFNLDPGQKGVLYLETDSVINKCDILYLSAIDVYGNEIYTWSWPVSSPEEIAQKEKFDEIKNKKLKVKEIGETWEVANKYITVIIDKLTGKLKEIDTDEHTYMLSNGPSYLHTDPKITNVELIENDENVVVNTSFEEKLIDDMQLVINTDGSIELNSGYLFNGKVDYAGIGFDFPEQQVLGFNYLGDGPYRVWKNRLKGTSFGIWEKEYNDAITGQRWIYPEFKGYYSNFYSGELLLENGKITIVNEAENIYLRLFTPQNGNDPRNTKVDFPNTDISFMHAIQPIGTKFKKSENLGPQGYENYLNPRYDAMDPFKIKIKFYFE